MRGEPPPAEEPHDWWKISFDRLYPILYRHRDLEEAERFVSVLFAEAGPPPVPLLDLGCGAGRHLRSLQRAGTAGIGLDYSAALLSRARAEGFTGPLVRGDMRQLPFRAGSLGSVWMIFTTFGYFPSEVENLKVLQEVDRVLRPGGRFLLDYVNAPVLRRGLVPRTVRKVDGLTVTERRRIDPGGSFVEKRVEIGPFRDGSTRRYRETLRLFDPEEIGRLLAQVRFRTDRRFGDYAGSRFDPAGSERLIVLATKEAAEP